MNKTIKNLLITAGSLALIGLVTVGVLKATAAPLNSFTCPYNTYTNILLSTPATVSQFVIANSTGTNTTVALLDNASTNLLYTNLAYTTTSWTIGTGTNFYTNYFGVVVSNNYTALVSNLVSSASNNVAVPAVFTATIPANTTVVFDGSYTFLNGIHATNGLGAVTISGTYR